jgi:type II secretory pathway component PulK
MKERTGSEGIILLLVLWVMVVLTILATSYFHLSSLQVQSTRNDLDKYQARLLAESAFWLAIADLNEESKIGYQDLSGDWAGSGKLFEEASLGTGLLQITTDDVYSEEKKILYGLRDESSKLNLNVATVEMLAKLPNMTPSLAAALIDWRDADDQVTTGGAEREYYNGLSPPYDPRNGPFQTVTEILQVKGFTPLLAYGEEASKKALAKDSEERGSQPETVSTTQGEVDRGLLAYLTIYSYDKNVDASGKKRLNINTAKADELKTGLAGKVSEATIKKIVEHRDKKKFESLVELLTATPDSSTAKPADTKAGTGSQSGSSPSPTPAPPPPPPVDSSSSGSAATISGLDNNAQNPAARPAPAGSFEAQLPPNGLMKLSEFQAACDQMTVLDKERLEGLININTAPKEVLSCLPGMTDRLAEDILSRRGADQQAFSSAADIVSLEGMNLDTFTKLLPLVTVRSYAFEGLAVGYLPSRKAYASIEGVIDRGEGKMKFLYYRVVR